MSDVLLFFIGCLVSLVVLSAVGLLLWGAVNEPKGSLLPDRERTERGPETRESVRANAPRSRPASERAVG